MKVLAKHRNIVYLRELEDGLTEVTHPAFVTPMVTDSQRDVRRALRMRRRRTINTLLTEMFGAPKLPGLWTVPGWNRLQLRARWDDYRHVQLDVMTPSKVVLFTSGVPIPHLLDPMDPSGSLAERIELEVEKSKTCFYHQPGGLRFLSDVPGGPHPTVPEYDCERRIRYAP